MLSHNEGWKRFFRLGAGLFAGFCLFVLAAGPASAQLDSGTKGWALVTGHWSKGAPDTVAWVDLETWKLVTKIDGAAAAADPEPQPWMPVAGDWDGSGVQSIKMFDPQSWKLVDLAEGPLASSADPQPQPWVPVAGNWDGRGIDTVRVFDLRDRSVHKIEEGPIKIDRYDPEPSPWRPLAGDWDGRGIDTVSTYQVDAKTASPDWVQVAGDWDGDGIDTFGSVYGPTGQLLTGTPEALRIARSTVVTGSEPAFAPAAAGGGSGCYTTVKDLTTSVHTYQAGGGICVWLVVSNWVDWTCCSLTPQVGGPYACGGTPRFKIKTYSGPC
jgi:hypothetical protein